MGTCFYCKGTIENSITNYITDFEGHSIIIKNVPCHKCRQCSKISFNGKTVSRIEEIISDLKKSLTEFTIIKYTA